MPRGRMQQLVRELERHRPFTFPQLEQMIDEGARISDLLLLVPKGTIHSGSVATRFGPLSVATSFYLPIEGMILIRHDQYIGVLR